MVLAESSGSKWLISSLETTAWIIAESQNPRISAQRISQAIVNDIMRA
jgi:hypothetical protein